MIEKTLDIYTDCSLKQKILGIGVLFIENEKETNFQYRTNGDLISEEFDCPTVISSTTIGELYAVYKALTEIRKDYDKIIVYTDNDSVYKLFNKLYKLKMQCTKESNRRRNLLLSNISNKCYELMENLNIEIRHIKGHRGVYGNEISDKLAKNARVRKIPFCNENDKLKILEFEFINSYQINRVKWLNDEVRA